MPGSGRPDAEWSRLDNFRQRFALQVLTPPRRITPEPVQFINTPLNLRICRRHQSGTSGIDLGAWVPSLEQATETGANFSSAFPLTPEEGANAVGQQYFGPVVLITNARCYSATDIFAAGFQDHRIGAVLGTDENTGAGGANVWTHKLLSDLLAGDGATPYVPLPKGAGMRVSIRRTLRVGALSGTPVEDLGVVPDELHRMTRRDLLEDNADLFDRAGVLLKDRKPHTVSVTDAVSVNGSVHLKERRRTSIVWTCTSANDRAPRSISPTVKPMWRCPRHLPLGRPDSTASRPASWWLASKTERIP